MLERFRAKQFDQGLIDAVDFVQRTYAANVGNAPPTAGATPPANRSPVPAGRGNGSLFTGSCFMWLVIGGVILLLLRVFANRNRGGYSGQSYPQSGPYGPVGYGQPGYPTTTGGGFGRGLL